MPDETTYNPLPFTAIFPDTNVFLPNWPAEPPGLANLLSTAEIFKIPVYFLETVELELEAHARSGIDKLKAQKEKLPPPLSAVCEIETPTLPDVSLYRKMANDTKSGLRLTHATFLETTLREPFQMAIDHEHPFVAEGKNFQDAVIITSVLDFSKCQNFSKVAFVSKNHKDFDPAKKWHEDNESAKRALERTSLEAFLISQLVSSEDVALELVEIEDVRVAWLDKITQRLQRVPVQITVSARFKKANFPIERGITIDGWAVTGDDGYKGFDFESAFISR